MTGDTDTDRVVGATLAALGLLLLGLTGSAAEPAPNTASSTESDPNIVRVDSNAASAPRGNEPPPLETDTPTLLFQSEGLRLEQQGWRWGDASGQAWRVSVPLPGRAEVEASDSVTAFAALLPGDPGPWATINGGFYERGAMGLVVSDGAEHSPLSRRGGSGVFSWSADSGPRIQHRSDWTAGAPQALQSIDRLVDAGHSLVKQRPTARSAARSAVAISSDRLWLVALADDASIEPLPRAGGAELVQLHDTVVIGLPLWAFADYLIDAVGAEQALNLDGAVSTQLVVQTPDRRFEVLGERGTINSLTIRP